MSEDKDKKQQNLKRNQFTLKGFMSILQEKPAKLQEKSENKDKK